MQSNEFYQKDITAIIANHSVVISIDYFFNNSDFFLIDEISMTIHTVKTMNKTNSEQLVMISV